MSTDSRSRFASPLVGRGLVIKRSGRSPDAVSSGSRSISGSKRSVKDRLGDRPDDSSEARSHQKHKRPKGTQNNESCHRNSSNDTRITKGDLRFKLMEKKDPPNDVDLRDKLSSKAILHPSDGKKSHPSKATISITTRRALESRDISDDERQNVEDRAYERKKQSRRELRNSGGGKIMQELGDNVGGQSTHEHRDSGRRKSRRESGDSPKRQNMRELGANVCRQRMLETREISDDERKNVEDRAYERERQIRRDISGSGGGQIMRELGDSVGGQSTYKHRDSGRGQSQLEFGESPRRQNMREVGASVCRQNMQELGDTDGRQGKGEVRDIVGRQSRHEFRDGVGWQSMGESLNSYNVEKQSIQEPSVYSGERRSMQESWDAYNGGKPNMIDTRDCHDHGRQGIPGQIPSRIGCDLPAVGHVRTSYPSWMPETTRRSPDRMSCSSMTRTFSPERNVELQRRAFFRTYDDGSSSICRRNEVPTPHTVAGSAIYMNQPPLNTLPPMHAAPVPTLTPFPLTTAQFPLSSGMRVLNPGEQPTVIGFLQSIGLEKYAINFQHEEVDFHTLRQMTDSDLKELHIPMGPRKKIIQAMLPPPRR